MVVANLHETFGSLMDLFRLIPGLQGLSQQIRFCFSLNDGISIAPRLRFYAEQQQCSPRQQQFWLCSLVQVGAEKRVETAGDQESNEVAAVVVEWLV